ISPTSTPEMKTFSKEIQTIDNQAVILYKPTVTTSTTPIIIYSHGSNEHITTNGPTPQFFVEALDTYGNYFAQNGILFVASEMYGENWGSTESLNHLKALIKHVQNEYEIESKPNLYGFSMGGLPTLRFAKTYPDSINKIALLAPTINMPDWNEASLRTLNDIPIRIWHGTKDVNVPPTLSEAFYQAAVAAGNTTITRNTITNETHRHFLKPATLLDFFEPER
ncbi:alpha/beta fold hydrolase, partial [candidate division WWE3 bacterium]|nr:alpha/beta fold hydrolase [candidate division WWE3 bacterium]